MKLNKFFIDYVKDVLEYSGKSRDDTGNELAKAKRRTNDAYNQFLESYDWYFLRKEALITTVAGQGDYDLPEDFDIFKSKPYTSSSSIYNYPKEVDNETLLRLRSECNTTGTPYYFATDVSYTAEGGIKTILRIYPTPTEGITYIYSYKPYIPELVEDEDIPYCPPNMRYLLRAFCLAEVESFVEEDAKKGWISKVYQFLLPAAIRLDSKKRPSTIIADNSQLSQEEIRRQGKVYYNGTEI
jgi:hypothetical protein